MARADGQGPDDEAAEVRDRYARRVAHDPRYSFFEPAALEAHQERLRVTLRLLKDHGLTDTASLRVLEVGCGDGGNLLDFLRLGCAPHHLCGIELLAERHARARTRLPAAIDLRLGDAVVAEIAAGSFDIVHQSTVFSSLLDDDFQQRLADAMWRWVRPGGGVLWHDFTVDNPRNRDVRGVPLRRIRALFPDARIDARRVTLAPPIARFVSNWPRGVHSALRTIAPLRTHLLAWIGRAV